MSVSAAEHRDFPFSDQAFRAIAQLAHSSFGLHLEPAKKQLVYSRLTRRLRALGLSNFEDYCAMLNGPNGDDERKELLSALTTNVTQFFRERHHFEQLSASVLPHLIARAREGGRVRLWSAGCSAGQEAYSLALILLWLCPEATRLDIRILATDIDPQILARARAAQYPLAEYAAIPRPLAKSHTTVNGDTFSIAANARALVAPKVLNLIEPWPMTGRFDVIMCRNVAIYFSEETQARLWSRFSDVLARGGHLMIGHSERLSGRATAEFTSTGITAYCKN